MHDGIRPDLDLRDREPTHDRGVLHFFRLANGTTNRPIPCRYNLSRMQRSLLHLWYLWFFDLPRDLSGAEIDAVGQRLDVRLESHAKRLGIAMTLVVNCGGCIGGVFFSAWPAALLMSIGFNRILAYMTGAMIMAVLGCMLGGFLVYLLALVLGRNTWVVEARQAVRDIGREVCVHCGYWLRGLGDDVTACPECGTKREPMPPKPEVLPEACSMS